MAVVNDPVIHELNRRFLEHDYPTDVLSFALERDGDLLEGEVVVSADTARRTARALRGRPSTSCCYTSFMARCTWPATTIWTRVESPHAPARTFDTGPRRH